MEFKTFSPKQKLAMSWWSRKPYRDYDAIICDGASARERALSMSSGFISWAMTSFQSGSFALCGKTITALKRNVMTPLLGLLGNLGSPVWNGEPELCGHHPVRQDEPVLSLRRQGRKLRALTGHDALRRVSG